jgi:hypothetical protein
VYIVVLEVTSIHPPLMVQWRGGDLLTRSRVDGFATDAARLHAATVVHGRLPPAARCRECCASWTTYCARPSLLAACIDGVSRRFTESCGGRSFRGVRAVHPSLDILGFCLSIPWKFRRCRNWGTPDLSDDGFTAMVGYGGSYGDVGMLGGYSSGGDEPGVCRSACPSAILRQRR